MMGTYCFLIFHPGETLILRQVIYFFIFNIHWSSQIQRTNFCCAILQVVRYHSLIIDKESLPKELVPIAWTIYDDTGSFSEKNSCVPVNNTGSPLGNGSVIPVSEKLENRSHWPSSHVNGKQDRHILMGIMHSSFPHYGLQVWCLHEIVFRISFLHCSALWHALSFQFHPESIATTYGSQLFKNFKDITVNYWSRCKSTSLRRRNINDTGELL